MPGQAEGHAHGDETRLDAVVQVAFDASALQLGGADSTGALLAGGADSLGELAAAGKTDERGGEGRVGSGGAESTQRHKDAEDQLERGEAYLAVHEVTQCGPQEPGSRQGAPQEHEPHQPADHEGGERSAHGQGRALTPEPAQVGAEAGRGRPRGERHGSAGQAVEVLDPGGLEACEADHEVDEQDEEQQADPEQGDGRRRKREQDDEQDDRRGSGQAQDGEVRGSQAQGTGRRRRGRPGRGDGAADGRVGATALGGEAEAVAGDAPMAGVAGSGPRGTCSTVMGRTLVAGWRRRPPG